MIRRKAHGFTLIEVIVALTLMSLIMLGLLSALRSLADSSRRTDENTQRIDQIRLVGDFLRRSIGQAMPVADYSAEHGHIVHFLGAPDHMRWLAPFPAHQGPGGLHVMHLHVSEQPPALILDYRPYPGQIANTEDLPPPTTHTVVGNIETVRFQYRQDAMHAWADRWEDLKRLPGQIRVNITRGGRVWPDIIIALRASEKPI